MPVDLYLQPNSMEALTRDLSFLTESSFIVSGCTDFLAQRNGKAWHADALLSLARMRCLKEIRLEGNILTVGAACTHAQISQDPLAQTYLPALAQAAGQIGSVQIRNRGTIGGNIANASPAGDTIVCAALYNAQAVVWQPYGECRAVSAVGLAGGAASERLQYNEVITGFRFPLPNCGHGCFIKLGTRSSVTISRISLAASWRFENGCLDRLSVWVGAIAPMPVRLESTERLCGLPLGEELHARFLQELPAFVNGTMAERPSKGYKAQAAKGLADDLYQRICREACR